jgi:tetratricopeptide (TPR) repeat protein
VIADNQAKWELHLSEGVRFGKEMQFDRAVREFQAAITLCPESADGYFNLGVAYRSLNRQAEAREAFERAVSLRPEWAEAQFNLGNAYRDARDRENAIRCFDRAVASRPGYLKALNNLANLYFEQGHVQLAEKHLRTAIAHKPDYSEGLFNLGRVLRRQRKLKEAFEITAKAAQLQPNNHRYQAKLAELQRQTGQPEAAIKTLRNLLASNANHLQAVIQLATLLRDQKQEEEALGVLNQAIIYKRFNADILWLRADIRRLIQQYDDALEDLAQALVLDPDSAPASNLQGVVHFAKGEPLEAITSYERAIAIKPDLVEAHNNLGAALQSVRRYAESRTAFDAAVRLKPDFAVARLNRALSILRDGEFREGWREFEWRFLCQDYRLASMGCSTWMGEPLDGRTILLRTEQGLGDTIQFIRYAPLVKQRGGRVLVECQEAICELVSRCDGVEKVYPRGAPLPHIDTQIPLMSLPNVFETTIASIPAQSPYLTADCELVEKWRERLRPLGQLVVGIAWQGNKKFQADHLRSLPVKEFRPLGEVPDVALVSLQKNVGVEQLTEDLGFNVHQYTDELDASGPFRDTAAIIMACDLVVTSDTAIAHLAGALGKPVWVALSYSADWRWLVSGEQCPWYPTMRLFRQAAYKDWASVFDRMADELTHLVRGDQTRLQPAVAEAAAREIKVETAPGELLDKITILEIKSQRVSEPEKLANVRCELESLNTTRSECIPTTDEIVQRTAELRVVNEKLWNVEDELRICESEQEFGPGFVELARSVYVLNDERAALKRQINVRLHSRFREEKSYVEYGSVNTPLADVSSVRSIPALPMPPTGSGFAEEWAGFRLIAREQASHLAREGMDLCDETSLGVVSYPRVGIVVGHYDSPDFIQLNLAVLRKHCGNNLPILIADDCTPGSIGGTDENRNAVLSGLLSTDSAACIWTNQVRFGHVLGDLSVLAKGIMWASEMKLDVLFKLSQRLMIDRPHWITKAVSQLKASGAAVLGRGCTHFGWKIRTESMAVDVSAWNRNEILQDLFRPEPRRFAEQIVWKIAEDHLGGTMAEWDLLTPSRQERSEQVYFRATHRSDEYARLAQTVGLKPGRYPCSEAEFNANYRR